MGPFSQKFPRAQAGLCNCPTAVESSQGRSKAKKTTSTAIVSVYFSKDLDLDDHQKKHLNIGKATINEDLP